MPVTRWRASEDQGSHQPGARSAFEVRADIAVVRLNVR